MIYLGGQSRGGHNVSVGEAEKQGTKGNVWNK